MSISVGLPIWHSVSADTDRDFPISAKPIIGRYTDISADTDTYRLLVCTLREPVVNRQKDLPNWAELAVCVKGLHELF